MKSFWVFVVLTREGIDGGVKVEEQMLDAAFEAANVQPIKETFGGIEQ